MKITEKWLKAHGWEISHYDLPVKLNIFHYATKMFGKDRVELNEKHQLTIFRDYKEPCDVYADVLIDNVDTIVKLYQSLSLCGICDFEEYDWLHETWLDKACEWLRNHLGTGNGTPYFIKAFRKAMEGISGNKEEIPPKYDADLEEIREEKSEIPTNLWHNALNELPEEEKEVIVIYDNGYLCYNHRPKKGGYSLRPDGKKVPYEPLVDESGWCDFSNGSTRGHKVILWTETPLDNQP